MSGTPRWAAGMHKLGPGIYADSSGALHVSEREFCAHFNVPCTPENAATIKAALLDVFTPADGQPPEINHIEDDEGDG